MKYFKTQGMYKASNVTLNANTLEAYSYGWWRFTTKAVRRETGERVVLFNDYPYSATTTRHQSKVRDVLVDDMKLKLVFGESMKGFTYDNREVLADMKNNLSKKIAELVAELERKRGRKGSEDANARRELELDKMRDNLCELENLELI